MKPTKSTFIKVKCAKCKNEQNTFSNASTPVLCLVCNEPLAHPQGGKSRIVGSVLETH